MSQHARREYIDLEAEDICQTLEGEDVYRQYCFYLVGRALYATKAAVTHDSSQPSSVSFQSFVGATPAFAMKK